MFFLLESFLSEKILDVIWCFMTDLYSYNNYRKALIEQASGYYWILRDEALMNKGMQVSILIPINENNINEYNDFIDESENFKTIQTFIEPQFDKYVLTLSLLGQDMERDYPLEICIMSQIHLPRNSIIQMPEINSLGTPLVREWRVLSTEIKQQGNIYTRVAFATPVRSFEKMVTDIVEASSSFVFECDDGLITKDDDVWNIPIEINVTGNLSVLNCLVYEPYGVVECFNKQKIVVLQPTIKR